MDLRINIASPVSHNTTLTAVQLAQVKADLEPLLEDGNVSNIPAADKWALLEDLAYSVQPVFLENYTDKMNVSQVFYMCDAYKRGKKVGSPDASIRVLRNVIEDLTPLPCGKWKRVKTRRYANNNRRLIPEPVNNTNEAEYQWFGAECPTGRGNRPARRKTRKARKV